MRDKKSGDATRGEFHLATRHIESVDDLRECMRGADIDVVQLAGGQQQGSLTHLGMDNLEMTLGRFALQVRARGIINPTRVTLGMLLASTGRVTMWGREMRRGDVVVIPSGCDLEAIFTTGAAYAAVSLPLPQLLSQFGNEELLAQPDFWTTSGVWATERPLGEEITRRLSGIFPRLERNIAVASLQDMDFLRRTIVEAFVTSLLAALPPLDQRRSDLAPAHLVRDVENYADAAGDRAIHLSEICTALGVSRRTLHRAFSDALDIGPAAYLRSRRLAAVHRALQRSDPERTSIGDIAFQYGFAEPGRFAAYYKSMFGQSPSKSLGSFFSGRVKTNAFPA